MKALAVRRQRLGVWRSESHHAQRRGERRDDLRSVLQNEAAARGGRQNKRQGAPTELPAPAATPGSFPLPSRERASSFTLASCPSPYPNSCSELQIFILGAPQSCRAGDGGSVEETGSLGRRKGWRFSRKGGGKVADDDASGFVLVTGSPVSLVTGPASSAPPASGWDKCSLPPSLPWWVAHAQKTLLPRCPPAPADVVVSLSLRSAFYHQLNSLSARSLISRSRYLAPNPMTYTAAEETEPSVRC